MFNTILVPVDPGETSFSTPALETAARFARDYDGKVRLVAVLAHTQGFVASYLPEDFEKTAVAETRNLLEDLAKGLGLPEGSVSVAVRLGSVYHEVIEEAEAAKADLIVMGSHKPALSTYLIGSNAAHIVRHAPCSVMVLRPNKG
ncbi:universal stress protein [Polymorphum gilvum]|uniref:Universal stress protein family, putative n=1 Tax=Polymorphum gilvum (strain LMG 25793 / CGMCC 1.9160 / SL003B-26A1) TaxID=991905 RepID=F2J408_POLGS|nr:universal stress protein [Polymorphum gilvum]ADZ69934.1 Universal stress protein family, putative [Polymorphum gilvum SL003B-26A1]